MTRQMALIGSMGVAALALAVTSYQSGVIKGKAECAAARVEATEQVAEDAREFGEAASEIREADTDAAVRTEIIEREVIRNVYLPCDDARYPDVVTDGLRELWEVQRGRIEGGGSLSGQETTGPGADDADIP